MNVSARHGSTDTEAFDTDLDRQDAASRPLPWWATAVVYQVYVRSFFDSDGDGFGDLNGVRERLSYLADLGVDALWFTPWYPSPLADGGYDIADYRAIDPRLGSLADAEHLIREARARNIRTIIDIVPNHVSSEHPWFKQALASSAGSSARQRFWFQDGRADGIPPNGWVSEFAGAGPAWTQVVDGDGTPGQWYLHLFTPGQPDLNWDHPDVAAEHAEVLRFWFDRGVAGARIDSAALLVKDPTLAEVPAHPGPGEHPHADRDGLHDIYRSWRHIADSYPEPRLLVGEVWLADADRFVRYLRPDELHTAFNFDLMTRPWSATAMAESIDSTLAVHARVGATSTWVLSNHDITRPVTRYGRADTSFAFSERGEKDALPVDVELGRRRARAAALLQLALPGSAYIYQGDELGLEEVTDIPADRRVDPMFLRSGGSNPGRDGCRVPLPWSGSDAPFGFSGSTGQPWLPQPARWAGRTAADQVGHPESTLELYRKALVLRRRLFTSGDALQWIPSGADVLAFRRGEAGALVNLGTEPVELPATARPVLASAPLAGRTVPPDTGVWFLSTAGDPAADC